MTDTYTPELRAKDADIALAMGWRWIVKTWPGGARKRFFVPPSYQPRAGSFEIAQGHEPIFSDGPITHPFFHTSEDARRSLLEWLAADLPRWKAFLERFWKLRKGQPEWAIDIENGHYAMAAMYMLATPAQVAEAAWPMIQEEKK